MSYGGAGGGSTLVCYHAIGDDGARGGRQTGEQAHGMAAVHDQRLLFAHLAEVVHHQPELHRHTHSVILNSDASAQTLWVNAREYLRPVTEHLAVASVGDQLLGELEGKQASDVARKRPLGALKVARGSPERLLGPSCS